MAKTKTTSRKKMPKGQRKLIHHLPCGCKCWEVPTRKPRWERCFKAELLAEQFGMGNITLNEYSNHFLINQNEQANLTW